MLIIFVAGLGLFGQHLVSHNVLRSSVNEDLQRVASAAAGLIDAQKHASLNDPKQLNSAEYLEIVAPLRRLGAAMPEIKYLYTVRPGPEGPRFVVDAAEPGDSDGDGVNDQAALGELYTDPDPALLESLKSGEPSITAQPYTDKWGTFISAYVPVRRPDGTLECIVGADMAADQYLENLAAIDRALVFGGLLAGVASVGLGILIFAIQRRRLTAVDSLLDSQALFSQISTAAPVMLWMVDRERRPTFFSRSWLEFSGRTLESECVDSSESIHPEDRTAVEHDFAEAFGNRRPFEIEYRLRRADGVYRWVLSRGMPRTGSTGEFLGYVGGAIDVTERHDAAAKQAVALELATGLGSASTFTEAARLVNDALDRSLGFNRTAVLLFASDGVCRFVGWRGISETYRRAVEGHCPWARGEQDVVPIVVDDCRIEPSMRSFGELFEHERIVSLAFVPVMTEDGVAGKFMLYSDVARGITAEALAVASTMAAYLGMAVGRLSAQERVTESERRVRTVIDTALDAVVAIDAHGHVVDWNSQAERTFGWTKSEAVGRPMAELIIPETHREAHRQGLSRFLETGKGSLLGKRVEVPACRRDGSLITVELAITPLHTSAGPQFSAFIRDITEKKSAEQELIRTRDAAEASNRTKSEFLANMSHEIRTPMTAILGFADLLEEEGDYSKAPERRKDAIATIKRHGEGLLTIINDILDLSKIEAGKMAIEIVECNVESVIEEVLSLMRIRAAERRLTLELVHETPIPVSIRTDPTRLKQVLINLVGNALKFTETGGVTVTLGCDAAAPGGPVMRFGVTDTGIGLSEEQQSRIFRAFEQADASTTRRFGGTGLGLRISQRLVELLGGRIEVESKPGAGSTFFFTISAGPLAGVAMLQPHELVAQAERQRLAAMNARRATVPLRPLEGVRVLLAEDGVDNQRLISHHLRNAGATVTLAANGQIAIDLLTQAGLSPRIPRDPPDYDLVLMDMQMPEVDGYTAAKQLRSCGFTLPIIALTAHAMRGDREKCLAAGCDEYVSKPIDKQHLLTTCRRMLDQYRAAA